MITLDNGWVWDTGNSCLISPPLKSGERQAIPVSAVTAIKRGRVEAVLPGGEKATTLLNCEHGEVERCGDSARCKSCGERLGWWCPESPDHLCQYTESFDCCDFCRQPEERK